MPATPAIRTVEARASVLTAELARHGWTRVETKGHQDAARAVTMSPPADAAPVRLLVVAYTSGEVLTELFGDPTHTGGKGGRGGRPSWRLSATDAPPAAVIAAAHAAAAEAHAPVLDLTAWTRGHVKHPDGTLRSTVFTRPGGLIVAAFLHPDVTGEPGAWLIGEPDAAAQATAHTPAAVVTAYVTAIPMDASHHQSQQNPDPCTTKEHIAP